MRGLLRLGSWCVVALALVVACAVRPVSGVGPYDPCAAQDAVTKVGPNLNLAFFFCSLSPYKDSHKAARLCVCVWASEPVPPCAAKSVEGCPDVKVYQRGCRSHCHDCKSQGDSIAVGLAYWPGGSLEDWKALHPCFYADRQELIKKIDLLK